MRVGQTQLQRMPRPTQLQDLDNLPVTAPELNGTIFLEREIGKVGKERTTHRRAIIAAALTARNGAHGIELSVARVAKDPLVLESPGFRAVSIVSGRGRLQLAGEEIEIGPHDHFGIPSGLSAIITCSSPSQGDPLVLLESVLGPS